MLGHMYLWCLWFVSGTIWLFSEGVSTSHGCLRISSICLLSRHGVTTMYVHCNAWHVSLSTLLLLPLAVRRSATLESSASFPPFFTFCESLKIGPPASPLKHYHYF